MAATIENMLSELAKLNELIESTGEKEDLLKQRDVLTKQLREANDLLNSKKILKG